MRAFFAGVAEFRALIPRRAERPASCRTTTPTRCAATPASPPSVGGAPGGDPHPHPFGPPPPLPAPLSPDDARLDGFVTGAGCERLADTYWARCGGVGMPDRPAALRYARDHIRRCWWCGPEWDNYQPDPDPDDDGPGGGNPPPVIRNEADADRVRAALADYDRR